MLSMADPMSAASSALEFDATDSAKNVATAIVARIIAIVEYPQRPFICKSCPFWIKNGKEPH
jgi:hypothetical protein